MHQVGFSLRNQHLFALISDSGLGYNFWFQAILRVASYFVMLLLDTLAWVLLRVFTCCNGARGGQELQFPPNNLYTSRVLL